MWLCIYHSKTETNQNKQKNQQLEIWNDILSRKLNSLQSLNYVVKNYFMSQILDLLSCTKVFTMWSYFYWKKKLHGIWIYEIMHNEKVEQAYDIM